MDEMKLHIWVDPNPIPYGSSLLIVVAASLTEAREIAFDKLRSKRYSYGEFEQPPLKKWKLRKPDRIVSLPCAEWHEWSE